jgi:prepilin-type N-terminal cleavage/methylation domain-containing protein
MTWLRDSKRVGAADDGFTVSELLIALVVIGLVTAGLSALTLVYARALFRTEMIASAARHQTGAERLVDMFVSSAARGDRRAWSCSPDRVAAMCATDEGGEAPCVLSLRPSGRGWSVELEVGPESERVGPVLARNAEMACDARLTSRGWVNDEGAGTIVLFLGDGSQRRPWVSAGP